MTATTDAPPTEIRVTSYRVTEGDRAAAELTRARTRAGCIDR